MSDTRKQATHKFRRSVDLLVPPQSDTEVRRYTIGEASLQQLIEQWEERQTTGCVKVISEKDQIRSAALLFKGKAVGCLFSGKGQTLPESTEASLKKMLRCLKRDGTQVISYDLDNTLVLASCSLFIGHPVERADGLDASAYVDHFATFVESKQHTAALSGISMDGGACIALWHKGSPKGSFDVERQTFNSDSRYLKTWLGTSNQGSVGAWILVAMNATPGLSLTQTSIEIEKSDD